MPWPEFILNYLKLSVSIANIEFLTSLRMIFSDLKSLNISKRTPFRSENLTSFYLAANFSRKFLNGIYPTSSIVKRLIRFSKNSLQNFFLAIISFYFNLKSVSSTSYQISSSFPISTSFEFFLQILVTFLNIESTL
jgi:hypothetical protein